MSEFKKVTTKKELDLLDEKETVEGYMAGLGGEDQPDSTKSKSYWHGWRNGNVDAGNGDPDEAQRSLARDCHQECVSTFALMELMASDASIH